MENRTTDGRLCLVNFRIGNGPIQSNVLGAMEDKNLEGLKLMLVWRDFLADGSGVTPDRINILSYVELFESSQADIAGLQ